MSKNLFKLSVLSFLSVTQLPVFAAKPIDLNHQPVSFLQSFSVKQNITGIVNANTTIQEVSQSTDFNQTLHIRVQQFYAGVPVWGGDAVIHVPQGKKSLRGVLSDKEDKTSSMNGTFYDDLSQDLQAGSVSLDKVQSEKAYQSVFNHYVTNNKTVAQVDNKLIQPIVYIDEQNKAHYAFYISFHLKQLNGMPAKPSYVVDAKSFAIFQEWNDVQTLEPVKGGGFGGNEKIGKLSYDGLQDHLPTLDMQRDSVKKRCYLLNDHVSVTDYRQNQIAAFSCEKLDKDHGNVYWDGDFDRINGGNSPNNDALYAGKVISELYQNWYHIPVLTKDDKPMLLEMVTHSPNIDENGNPDPENAAWDGDQEKMFFGDGKNYFYPLTSVSVAAHEISHGFTQQHSNLKYFGQSGGMNESFSDMAAQAAEEYSSHQNSWQIGAEISKAKNTALRYMDEPTKDCVGRNKNECSIDNATQYRNGLNVHYSSGVFNRFYYLLSNSPDWSVRKAFDVMVQANSHYWTPLSTFTQGACGVLKATNDYHYDLSAVTRAFSKVGIDTSAC